MATLAERQAEIDAAITSILTGGQSVTISGRTYTKANLDILLKMQENIERKIDREGTSQRTVAEF